MTHSLTLGTLLLTGDFPDEDYGFTIDVLADGASLGSGAGVREVIQSLLVDGDYVRMSRYGNREVSFRVEIEGPTLEAVAFGEAALRAQVGRSNTLTWQPPDTIGAASVFEVITSEMSQQFDDLDEVLRRKRTFAVTLTCKPFAMSTSPQSFTVLSPPPVTPVTATITDADATTGFSAQARATYPSGVVTGAMPVTDEGSYVQTFVTGQYPTLTMTYTASSPVATSTTPYIVVEASGDPADGFRINGTIVPIALAFATSAGTTKYVLNSGGVPVSSVQIGRNDVSGNIVRITLRVHDISRTNTIPQLGAKQGATSVTVGGTERTQASLRVKSPSSTALGHTILASWPEQSSGFSPPMRRWRSTGNGVAPNATAISGSHEALGPAAVKFLTPASSIPPGAYQLLGRMRSTSGTGTIPFTWEVGTSVQGVLLPGVLPFATDALFPVANRWEIIPIGTLNLPVIAASQGDLYLYFNPAAPTLEYDEFWLLPVGDDCSVTCVNASDATYVWTDPPPLGDANPVLRVGSVEDRSNARSPGLGTFGRAIHSMRPGPMTVFVACEVASVTADGSLVERWHSNAAR